MSSRLFRPQDIPKKFIMQERMIGGGRVNYNFCNRVKWYPAGWGLNKKVLGKMHSKLHYLACHAPEPVKKKWQQNYKVFYAKHFGSDIASVRFLNNHSCHAWM